ncbi:hypothetical protein GI374_14995 [Paracoccus sp. S-4012]|nr:hypothetical protein [Paracoccus sp. S-4012]
MHFPYSSLEADTAAGIERMFTARYREIYGMIVPDGRIEIVAWRLTGAAASDVRALNWGDGTRTGTPSAPRQRPIFLPQYNRFGTVDVFDRYDLAPGTVLRAPLILPERESTIVVAFPASVRVLDASSNSTVESAYEGHRSDRAGNPLDAHHQHRGRSRRDFLRTAFSSLAREANDYAVVLTDAEGPSVAQSTVSEGLQIPMLKLVEAGVPNGTIVDFIRTNI